MENHRPKIGLALRGASTRSMFYIGFLEALSEQKLPIDYIAALSGSAIVSAAYACGTLRELKDFVMHWNAGSLYKAFGRSHNKTGLYNMDKGEELMRQFTHNLRFEEVKPAMGFVTVDINKGEEVVLSMGDIARAARATCSLPWIFEPVAWGNKALVDGGIINFIPGNVARAAGMDIVIGVDLRTTKYIFSPIQWAGRRFIKMLRSVLLLNHAERFGKWIETYFEENDAYAYFHNRNDETEASPGMFAVLGKSMDLAFEAQRRHKNEVNFQCDIVIRPDMPKPPFLKKLFKLVLIDFSNSERLYQLGRETAQEYAPKIWQMMADFESQQAHATEKVRNLIKE